jgi:DNA-binding transcriptional regulator YhcF (GntR family)
VGSGTFISDKKPVMEEDEPRVRLNRKIQEVLARFVQEMRGLGVEKQELVKLLEDYREEAASDRTQITIYRRDL